MSSKFASESASRVVQTYDETWREFRNTVGGLGPDVLEKPTGAGWSIKEMLGHVAFWEEAPAAVITGMFRDGNIEGWQFGSGYVAETAEPWPKDAVHNAREAEWARSRTAREVLDRWDRAHENLISILKTVTDQEVEENKDYFSGLSDHLREHLAEVRAAL
jgi:uncharacterized protein (TIGR03083 family)